MTDEVPKEPERPTAWFVRHRWKLGFAAAGLLGWWWQQSQKKRSISVERVSQDWLMQHEVEAGRDPIE